MTSELAQATRPFVGRVAGRRVLVRAGDLYRADDPVVKAFPGKFRAPIVLSSAPPPAPARPAPAAAPSNETKAELLARAVSAGVDVSPTATKAEIQAALDAA